MNNQPGRRKFVAVIGGHTRNTTDNAMQLAEAFGKALALRGYGVVCGGGDGVMEAACRGVRSVGGLSLGILKSNSAADANPWVEIAIPTSMDVASNNVIVWAACAVVAFEGRYGTLNEVALALDFRKPLLLLGNSALLNVGGISAEKFRHIPYPDPGSCEQLIDLMEEMISASPGEGRS